MENRIMRPTRMMLPILLLFAMTTAAEVRPTAVLRLIPESTLPGIPVSFLVTITNPTDQVLTVGNAMTLKATTGEGTFDVLGFMNQTEVGLPSEGVDKCSGEPCFRVPANEQRELLGLRETSPVTGDPTEISDLVIRALGGLIGGARPALRRCLPFRPRAGDESSRYGPR